VLKRLFSALLWRAMEAGFNQRALPRFILFAGCSFERAAFSRRACASNSPLLFYRRVVVSRPTSSRLDLLSLVEPVDVEPAISPLFTADAKSPSGTCLGRGA